MFLSMYTFSVIKDTFHDYFMFNVHFKMYECLFIVHIGQAAILNKFH